MYTDSQSPQEPVEFPADDAPAPGGVGATLLSRLGHCVVRLEDPALRPALVVHETRKDLKRVRALLRLCSERLPTRPLEKRAAAAARQLAPLRDADATAETLARLRWRADARQLEVLDAVTEWYAQRHRAVAGAPGLPRPIADEVAGELRAIAAAVQALDFSCMDAAALDAGLAAAWSGTASAFHRVVSKPRLPRFHDFRKAVKRELYQRELAGRPLDRMERATLKKLADVLGELQDLDVLRTMLREHDRWRGPMRRLVKQTMRELKGRALRLGAGRYPERSS